MFILSVFVVVWVGCSDCGTFDSCGSCVKNDGCGWMSSTVDYPSKGLDFKCVEGDDYQPKEKSETYLYYHLYCPDAVGPDRSIHKRRSIRKYDSTQISKGILEQVIGDAVWAPNCMDFEPLRWYVVQEKGFLKNISDYAHAGFDIFYDAPTVIFLFTKPGLPCVPFQDVDGGLATEALELSAYNLGLGTVTVGYSRLAEPRIREIVGASIEEHYVIAIVIGHAMENPTHGRKPAVIKFI